MDNSATTKTDLFSAVHGISAVKTLVQRMEPGRVLRCRGVSRGAQPFLVALLRRLLPGRVIVAVTEGVKSQELFHQDVETWLAVGVGAEDGARRERSLFFPAWEVMPHETKLPHVDVVSERLETLTRLQRNPGSGAVLVASVAALLQRTYRPDTMMRRTRVLRKGETVDPLDLVEWLEDQGYEPEARVNHKGEIALRGGILDIFPLISPWPVRLEFFGDVIESVRFFDPANQISREEVDEVALSPASELGILKAASGEAPGDGLGDLIEHLPVHSLILLFEPDQLVEQARRHEERVAEGDPFSLSWDRLRERFREAGCWMMEIEEAPLDRSWPGRVEEADTVELTMPGLEGFRPIVARPPEPEVAERQRRDFFDQLHRWLRRGDAVHVFCNNDGERQRFGEIWEEYGLGRAVDSERYVPTVQLGALGRGFLCEAARLVVVTDAEIFGRYRVQRPRRLKSPHARSSRSLLDIDFTELEEGDYVVHLDHGIGRYQGLQWIPEGGGQKVVERFRDATPGGQECLVLEYAGRDPFEPAPRLYVPVSEAHLVSKYVGAGKARPPLNKLGGGRWTKTKEQAYRAVKDLASELLSVQAAREAQQGHSFPPDVTWQREFEGAFLFEETPDQMKAITETKGDMETARPMDRLICGDVGYGKTEVAIRAAFKAVMGGKQVAILVPTTILAQQHFNTFRERMADYPVRIELLSRFRTPREQKNVLTEVAGGAVDILIGTHRLVQADVRFKDLGLVVVDEEQRFGVEHKERLKMMRKLVDVLTLSATPIPRTLYLALTGARDMSTIETPPQDRLPVETIVCEYDERTIRDAILREMNRDGQVYYLHNRVLDIHTVAQRLQTLVPDARIVVGHGQMQSDELESVMARFVDGEADVLLSTTIIESGLDIPNANTIVIDRADRFGLSDLYQLRGRVGRYKHQAYAYLLVPRHARMLTDARKRISAIKQYSSLGSGFKIAMRDLEIRGAGNLLGPQQSGHITAVGFDLYCQLLRQSVSSLKGEKVTPRLDVRVRLDFLTLNAGEEGQRRSRDPKEAGKGRHASASVPMTYVADPRQRIEVYRRLAEFADRAGLTEFRRELRDRFGALPPPMELLLNVADLKVVAGERGISAIETRDDRLMLERGGDYVMVGGKFPRLTKVAVEARLKEIRRWIESSR